MAITVLNTEFPVEWQAKWAKRGCSTIGDVLTVDSTDKIAKEFLHKIQTFEFNFKMDSLTLDRHKIFSPEFKLTNKSIYEFW